MQELIFRLKPEFIVEFGTHSGGSALFFAHICDILKNGKVLTVDSVSRENLPSHPRIQYLLGSSTADETVQKINSLIPPGAPVLLILDSDHTKKHVLQELVLYSPLVMEGGYIIVEDTMLNGHFVHDDGSLWGEGPMEAVQEFLKLKPDFAADRTLEKHLLTFNPGGYLRRNKKVKAKALLEDAKIHKEVF